MFIIKLKIEKYIFSKGEFYEKNTHIITGNGVVYYGIPNYRLRRSAIFVDENESSIALMWDGDMVNLCLYHEGDVYNYDDRATYDEASNTLLLDNFYYDRTIRAYNMGDDFKIEVQGDCEVGAIKTYGVTKSTSVNFTGTGTLTVNSDLDYDTAITVDSIGGGTINFGENVTVYAYGDEDKNVVTQAVAATNDSAEPNGFTFGNGKTYDEYSVSNGQQINISKAPCVDLSSSRYNYSYCLSSDTDPDGIYLMSWTWKYHGDDIESVFVIKKVYSFDRYVVYDNSFDPIEIPYEVVNELNVEELTDELAEYGFKIKYALGNKEVSFAKNSEVNNLNSMVLLKSKDDPDGLYASDNLFGEELIWNDLWTGYIVDVYSITYSEDSKQYLAGECQSYDVEEFFEKFEIKYTDEQYNSSLLFKVRGFEGTYPDNMTLYGSYNYVKLLCQNDDPEKLYYVDYTTEVWNDYDYCYDIIYNLCPVYADTDGDTVNYYANYTYSDEQVSGTDLDNYYSYLNEMQNVPECVVVSVPRDYSVEYDEICKYGMLITNSDHPGEYYVYVENDYRDSDNLMYHVVWDEASGHYYSYDEPVTVYENQFEELNYHYYTEMQPEINTDALLYTGYCYLYTDEDG